MKKKPIKTILDHQIIRGIAVLGVVLTLVTLVTAAVNRQWQPDTGKVVGQASGTVNYAEGQQNETRLQSVSGGAYIAVWAENNYESDGLIHYFAQKYNSVGSPVWTSPVELTNFTMSGDPAPAFILSADNTDGVFVTWQDKTFGSADRAIHTSHVLSDGSLDSNFGGFGGKILIDTNTYVYLMDVIPDGSGGLLYSYRHYYSSLDRLKVQRVSSTGTNLWGSGGTGNTDPVRGTDSIYRAGYSFADSSYDAHQFQLRNLARLEGAYSGKVMVVASTQLSTRRYGSSTQRLDMTTGSIELTAGGVNMGNNYADYNSTAKTQIASDGAGGAYISWKVSNNLDYVRVDGNAQMTTYCADNGNGTYFKRIDTGIAYVQDASYPAMISDNNGGVYFAYPKGQAYFDGDVNVAQTSSCTNTPSIITVSHTQGSQIYMQLANDGSNGTYVSWIYGNGQAMIQHVYNNSGTLSTTFGVGGLVDHTINIGSTEFISSPQSLVSNNSSSNGVIIAWYRDMGLPSSEKDNYIQRIDNPSLPLSADETTSWERSMLTQTPHAMTTNSELAQTIQMADGSYVTAWISRANNNIELRAEKLNTAGIAQWNFAEPGSGVLLYSSTNDSTILIPPTFKLLPSGTDFIVAIATYPLSTDVSDLYIQKYSTTDGSGLWNGGTPINVTNDIVFEQLYPNMLSDGSGGAFLTWHERCHIEVIGSLECPSQTNNIQATHLTSTGTVFAGWNSAGSGAFRPVMIDDPANPAGCHNPIISNGTGGFYTTYEVGIYDVGDPTKWELCPKESELFYPKEIHYSNISSTGTIIDTSQIVTTSNRYISHDTVSDGANGFITAYDSKTNGDPPVTYSLSATRVGSTSWTSLINEHSNITYQTAEYPQIVSNGNNGAIIAYQFPNSNGNQIHTANVNATNGTFTDREITNTVGGSSGGSFIGLQDRNAAKSIVEDGNGGAYLTYVSLLNRNWGGHIYLQKVNSNNEIMFTPSETIIETYSTTYDNYPIILPGLLPQITWTRQLVGETSKHSVVSQYFEITNDPYITSVSPAMGALEGGTSITINGNNFISGGTTVTLDGTACQSITVTSPQTLTCITQPHAAGSVDVIVTTINGSDTLIDGYAYANIPGEWSAGTTPIDGHPIPDGSVQSFPSGIRASDGHFISVWNRNSLDEDDDLIVQKINQTTGAYMWPDDGSGSGGMRITDLGTTTYNQFTSGNARHTIIADNSGGAYVVWEENHSSTTTQYDIMLQHVLSNGTYQYVEPINLSNYPEGNYIEGYDMISDGTGGVYLTWINTLNLAEYQIELRRVTSDGTVIEMLPGTGLPVGSASITPRLGRDSSNNVYIVYNRWDGTSSSVKFEAQRFFPDGSQSGVGQNWHEAFEIPLLSGETVYSFDIGVDSSNNIIVIYNSYLNPALKISAQRISNDGTSSSWFTAGVGGTAITSSVINASKLQIIPDGTDGAIAAWNDENTTSIIFAQKINSSGVIQWGENGLQISNGNNWEFLSDLNSLASDAAGGAIVGFVNQDNLQIVLQKITDTGTLLWPEEAPGTEGYTGFSDYTDGLDINTTLVGDNAGGAVVFWIGRDTASGFQDIYGQYYSTQSNPVDEGCTGPLGPGQVCGSQTIECPTAVTNFTAQPSNFQMGSTGNRSLLNINDSSYDSSVNSAYFEAMPSNYSDTTDTVTINSNIPWSCGAPDDAVSLTVSATPFATVGGNFLMTYGNDLTMDSPAFSINDYSAMLSVITSANTTCTGSCILASGSVESLNSQKNGQNNYFNSPGPNDKTHNLVGFDSNALLVDNNNATNTVTLYQASQGFYGDLTIPGLDFAIFLPANLANPGSFSSTVTYTVS